MTDVSNRISYEEVAEVDLDDLNEVPDEGLPDHFRAIAERATSAQLRRFLDGVDRPEGVDDDEEKPALTDRYIARRVNTVLQLRAARSVVDDIFKDLPGMDSEKA